ncbi:hypothetical protein [Acetobacterium wieringae]|uniref:hypothetical protein n=1 Tax=Acetobacterium wieringae TaxID=52694 RepID=UPI001E4646C4|nr:hypothetical protein [Acetobacterium wieringae]
MGRLSLTDVNKMAGNRQLGHEVEKGYWEHNGSSEKFKQLVAMDQKARQRPGYWGGAKK